MLATQKAIVPQQNPTPNGSNPIMNVLTALCVITSSIKKNKTTKQKYTPKSALNISQNRK
jgi:hypothetical protein